MGHAKNEAHWHTLHPLSLRKTYGSDGLILNSCDKVEYSGASGGYAVTATTTTATLPGDLPQVLD